MPSFVTAEWPVRSDRPLGGKTGKLCLQSHPAWASRRKQPLYGMESVMLTINWDLRDLTVQTHSGLRWTDIKRQLTGWRHLEGLDDRGLEDIGISCGSPASPHLISR